MYWCDFNLMRKENSNGIKHACINHICKCELGIAMKIGIKILIHLCVLPYSKSWLISSLNYAT